jgi:hypothetical protein
VRRAANSFTDGCDAFATVPGMKSTTKAILVGGGLAATFDILYAFVISAPRGVSPTRVLQSVASGLLGNRAFEGGTTAAAVGLLAHYGILFAAAALYLAASRRLPWLRERAMLCGLAFGVGVYLFMNFVVVPLSAVPFEIKYAPASLLQGFVSHAILVGLPIALAVRRFTRTEVRP